MTLLLNNPAKPHLKRWTKREYNDEVDRGAFQKQRIFLYRGELIEMPPIGALHVFGVSNVSDWLNDTFRPQLRVRIQCPFEAPGESMPEPDAALVTHEQMRRRPHPDAALLLIEVSDSSLELDHEKALEYAAAGVPEYWILDMRGRRVEIYREPAADPTVLHGFKYASHRVAAEGELVASLIRPDRPVTVTSLVAVE